MRPPWQGPEGPKNTRAALAPHAPILNGHQRNGERLTWKALQDAPGPLCVKTHAATSMLHPDTHKHTEESRKEKLAGLFLGRLSFLSRSAGRPLPISAQEAYGPRPPCSGLPPAPGGPGPSGAEPGRRPGSRGLGLIEERGAAQAITRKWESTSFSQQAHGHRARAVRALLWHSLKCQEWGAPEALVRSTQVRTPQAALRSAVVTQVYPCPSFPGHWAPRGCSRWGKAAVTTLILLHVRSCRRSGGVCGTRQVLPLCQSPGRGRTYS